MSKFTACYKRAKKNRTWRPTPDWDREVLSRWEKETDLITTSYEPALCLVLYVANTLLRDLRASGTKLDLPKILPNYRKGKAYFSNVEDGYGIGRITSITVPGTFNGWIVAIPKEEEKYGRR